MRWHRGVSVPLLAASALLAVAAGPAAAAEPADAAADARATPGSEQPKIDLEELAAERKARAALEENRVRTRIQRYLNAAAETVDEGEPGEAAALLERLADARLNTHERALVARLKAFVLYTEGDIEGAIAAFQAALAEEILPVSDEVRIRFNIAQLYAALQNWPKTIEAIHAWLPYAADPDPLAYYLLAVSHFQLEQFDLAIANAETAVDLAPDPKEGWLQLLAALYVQKEDYANATPVLEELVLRFPKRLYWVQLSLIYGARENYRHSLAVQQVAYLQGLLEEDKELRRLARSYLFADLPYQAAQVLTRGLAEERIEADAEVYEMLANSWVAAREYDRALEPLQTAAELSDDGQLYVRLGQVHLQREEWHLAAEMLQKAFDKGGLEKEASALLLLGIAHYNDENASQAREYFRRAARDESTRVQAERWIEHIDTEAGNGQNGDEGEAPVGNPELAGAP